MTRADPHLRWLGWPYRNLALAGRQGVDGAGNDAEGQESRALPPLAASAKMRVLSREGEVDVALEIDDQLEQGRRFQVRARAATAMRSEEHTSELQSLMRTSYAVFCWKKKKTAQRSKHKLQYHSYTTT